MSFTLQKFTKPHKAVDKEETLPWSCAVERFEQVKRDPSLLLFHCPFNPKRCHANQRPFVFKSQAKTLASYFLIIQQTKSKAITLLHIHTHGAAHMHEKAKVSYFFAVFVFVFVFVLCLYLLLVGGLSGTGDIRYT